MRILYFVSLFFHILSATIWIGGMLFLALIIVPTVRESKYHSLAVDLVHTVGVRFRFWGWVCLGTFLVTGIFNVGYRFQKWDAILDATTWQTPFGQTLAIKLAIFSVIVLLSLTHDFFIGPKATLLMKEAPHSPDAKRLRKQASWFGRLNLLLGLIVIVLATMLVRGQP